MVCNFSSVVVNPLYSCEYLGGIGLPIRVHFQCHTNANDIIVWGYVKSAARRGPGPRSRQISSNAASSKHDRPRGPGPRPRQIQPTFPEGGPPSPSVKSPPILSGVTSARKLMSYHLLSVPLSEGGVRIKMK